MLNNVHIQRLIEVRERFLREYLRAAEQVDIALKNELSKKDENIKILGDMARGMEEKLDGKINVEWQSVGSISKKILKTVKTLFPSVVLTEKQKEEIGFYGKNPRDAISGEQFGKSRMVEVVERVLMGNPTHLTAKSVGGYSPESWKVDPPIVIGEGVPVPVLHSGDKLPDTRQLKSWADKVVFFGSPTETKNFFKVENHPPSEPKADEPKIIRDPFDHANYRD